MSTSTPIMMMNNTDNSTSSYHSNTIFTLPSKDEEQDEMYESLSTTAQAPKRDNPKKQNNGPSLPWFVEYWSSTFFESTPLVENLCMCNTKSTAVVFEEDSSPAEKQEHPFKFDIPSEHSWRLRQMVASHDYSMMGDETGATTVIAGNNNNSNRDSIYPTKYPSIRKSSILCEDDGASNDVIKFNVSKSDSLFDCDEDDDDDDDDDSILEADDAIREQPSSGGLEQQQQQQRQQQQDYSTTLLYSCNSFDCLSSEAQDELPTTSHIRPRRMVTTPPSRSTRNQQRLQHPPSPSAQTYTTVSLTESFMKDFDEHDNDHLQEEQRSSEELEENSSLLMTSTTADFLKQWTEASSSLFRPKTVDDEDG